MYQQLRTIVVIRVKLITSILLYVLNKFNFNRYLCLPTYLIRLVLLLSSK